MTERQVNNFRGSKVHKERTVNGYGILLLVNRKTNKEKRCSAFLSSLNNAMKRSKQGLEIKMML